MKYYRLNPSWCIEVIEAVEVDRETESSVWIKGRRNSKLSSYENYFPTFSQAKEFAVARSTRAVEVAQRRLDSENAALAAAQKLQESGPEPKP